MSEPWENPMYAAGYRAGYRAGKANALDDLASKGGELAMLREEIKRLENRERST